MRFNPPPGWPIELGFTPDERWKPDPSWPSAPPGWSFWIGEEDEPRWGAGPEERDESAFPAPTPVRRRNLRPALIAGGAAVAAAAVTAVVLTMSGVLSSGEKSAESSAAETFSAESPRQDVPSPPPAVNPEAASVAQLRQIADRDRQYVASRLADVWIPQLSSKRPGIVDEGVVWDNARTLQEHLRLRDRYDAKLLWSGEWSTFDAPNFWVTVAPVTFSNAEGALRWCTEQGFDALHCYAKLVSTTHPVRGSTAHNR